MKMIIKVSPDEHFFNASNTYYADEILTPYFLINRDFVIDRLICDDIEIKPETSLVELEGFDYMLKKVSIPTDTQKLYVEYTGYLTGKTGCCPYVKEQITTEFTFIRWETFSYPYFCDYTNSNAIYPYINMAGKADIHVIVPNCYDVVASEKLTNMINNEHEKEYCYSSNNIQRNNFSCSIAKYKKISTIVGTICLLHECNELNINDIMLKAHQYMSEHFGKRDINANTIYAAIPDGFGSFVAPQGDVVYIQESTFYSVKDLVQIVHEYIHLGWNAKTEGATQRIRFFDEAYTCYFQMRVMEYLLGEKYMLNAFIRNYKHQMSSGYYKEVPIADFGRYECGDLRYTIGAIFLHELCKYIGESTFDKITADFLNKYRDIPATLEIFCDEYIASVEIDKQDDLKKFLDKWIYSTDEYKRYLD